MGKVCSSELRINFMTEKDKNILQESEGSYEQAEMNLLRKTLKRSYEERFLMLTQLYKIQQTLKKAKITHHNFPGSK